MKRNYMSIIFIVFIIGLLSGILIKDYYKQRDKKYSKKHQGYE